MSFGFQCDYIKPNYRDKAKLCYIDTGNFAIHIRTTEDFYKEVTNDVEEWFDHFQLVKTKT